MNSEREVRSLPLLGIISCYYTAAYHSTDRQPLQAALGRLYGKPLSRGSQVQEASITTIPEFFSQVGRAPSRPAVAASAGTQLAAHW